MFLIHRGFNSRSALPAFPAPVSTEGAAGGRIPKLKYLIVLISLILWVGLPEGSLHAMPPVQRTVLPNQLVLLASRGPLPAVCHTTTPHRFRIPERSFWRGRVILPDGERSFFWEHRSTRSIRSMRSSISWAPPSIPHPEETMRP